VLVTRLGREQALGGAGEFSIAAERGRAQGGGRRVQQAVGQAVREQFLQGEHAVDGHPHVHGANMGFSTVAYRQCGGFAPLATGEDVALIQAMHGAGMQVARLASPRVMTSARRHARAPHGFSEFLRRLEQRVGLATDEVVVGDAAPLSLLAR